MEDNEMNNLDPYNNIPKPELIKAIMDKYNYNANDHVEPSVSFEFNGRGAGKARLLKGIIDKMRATANTIHYFNKDGELEVIKTEDAKFEVVESKLK